MHQRSDYVCSAAFNALVRIGVCRACDGAAEPGGEPVLLTVSVDTWADIEQLRRTYETIPNMCADEEAFWNLLGKATPAGVS